MSGEVKISLSTGKTVTLKRPNVLSQYRLVDALGDSAENRVYLGMCVPLLYVTAIDNDPVIQPRTKREIEGLIQRLDDEGLAAISKVISENFTTTAGEVEGSAKKLPGMADSAKS